MKGLRRAQHHIAINVMLKMLLRLVTDPHRSHVAVATQMVHHFFGQFLLQTQAVQRLDMAALGLHHHVKMPAHIVFHGANLGQAVERAHHKKSIAQPAIAVVPVALAARCLGNAGGHGGNDGAGVFKERELERDGRADHGFLPLQRNVQALTPFAPVSQRLLLEIARCVGNALGQGLVRTQQKMMLARQQKRLARQQVSQGCVGGQAQRHLGPDKAHMVAAPRDERCHAPPVKVRVHRDAYTRRTLDRAHAPHQHGGPEQTTPALKARRKVGDLQPLPLAVKELRAQYRCVWFIALVCPGKVFNLYGKGVMAGIQFFSRGSAGVQQGVKHRVAVKARQATPHQSPVQVNQRTECAVADHAHGQRGLCGRGKVCGCACRVHGGLWLVVRSSLSHSRKASGLAQRWRARLGPAPTFRHCPPAA